MHQGDAEPWTNLTADSGYLLEVRAALDRERYPRRPDRLGHCGCDALEHLGIAARLLGGRNRASAASGSLRSPTSRRSSRSWTRRRTRLGCDHDRQAHNHCDQATPLPRQPFRQRQDHHRVRSHEHHRKTDSQDTVDDDTANDDVNVEQVVLQNCATDRNHSKDREQREHEDHQLRQDEPQ